MRNWSRLFRGVLYCVALVGLVAALQGCASRSTVEAYCSYGAVSQEQLDGCVSHVTEEVVDGYDTNAARYARGEIDDCRADAGPFCEPR